MPYRDPTRRYRFSQPPAVVVGVCGHGLATIRALKEGDVPVIGLETGASRPGTCTRLAATEMVPDINGPALVDTLLALRARIDSPGLPVLYLTNDTMIRTVGSRWDRLDGLYALSWAHARERLLPLLDKETLQSRCRETGMAYPASFEMHTVEDAERAAEVIGFPMIVKPCRPLSRFKTSQPATARALRTLAERFGEDLPFLAQQYIPGDDTVIYFTAFYLDHGKVLARFDGRKLRSRPLGHTTVGEPMSHDGVCALARRFFDGLELSGPVSLELKADPAGRFWVIEPTVGRTDFWLGLCTANGVNLSLTEYRHQTGGATVASAQTDRAVWFNEERDPIGRLWLGTRSRLGMRGRRGEYLFLHWDDLGPTLAFLLQWAAASLQRAGRLLWRAVGAEPGRQPAGPGGTADAGTCAEVQCRVSSDFAALRREVDFNALTRTAASAFEVPEWLDNLHATCAVQGARLHLMSAVSPEGCTVLALRQRDDGLMESLSNYYAPIFGPVTTDSALAVEHARHFAAGLASQRVARLQIRPLDLQAPFWQVFMEALRSEGYWVDSYFVFGNWYHPCEGVLWSEYLASRPSRLRNTIVRTRRKFQGDPRLQLQVLAADSAPEVMAQAIADFESVYLRSWKRPEPFPKFIPSLGDLAHRHGWLRVGVSRLDGEPIGAQIWLVRDGVASIYKLAYDQRHAKLGIGTAVTSALAEHVLDVDRVREIDFLAGDDAYKSEWMACRREREGIVAFHPLTAHGLASAIRHFGGRLLRKRRVDANKPR